MARGGALTGFACLTVILALFMSALLPATVQAQAPAPSPEMQSDAGHAIDQGIAYFLLFLALVLTYLIPLDAYPSFF